MTLSCDVIGCEDCKTLLVRFDVRWSNNGPTEVLDVFGNHTLPYTSSLTKPPYPYENRCPDLVVTREPEPNSNKQTKIQRKCGRIGPYCVRTKT